MPSVYHRVCMSAQLECISLSEHLECIRPSVHLECMHVCALRTAAARLGGRSYGQHANLATQSRSQPYHTLVKQLRHAIRTYESEQDKSNNDHVTTHPESKCIHDKRAYRSIPLLLGKLCGNGHDCLVHRAVAMKR